MGSATITAATAVAIPNAVLVSAALPSEPVTTARQADPVKPLGHTSGHRQLSLNDWSSSTTNGSAVEISNDAIATMRHGDAAVRVCVASADVVI
jgi:hypothetical protein